MGLRYRIALAGLALASASLGALCCTSGSGAGSSERDAGAAIDAPAPTTSSIRDAKSDAPKPPKLSADGWQSIYDENSDCLLEVPSTAAAMPPPIRWEPCDEAFADAGVPCRQMAADWPVPDAGIFTSALTPASARVLANGTVLLGLLRSEVQRVVLVVAEADGAVRTAMRNRRDSDLTLPCGMGGDLSVGETHSAWQVTTASKPDRPYAFMAKTHDGFEVPRLYYPSNRPTGYFSAGHASHDSLLVAGLAQLDLVEWETGKETTLVRPGASGSDEPGDFQFFNREILWRAGYATARIYRSHAGSPAEDILRAAIPTGRTVASFGADAHDLVWMEALPPGGGYQTVLALWTVPSDTSSGEVATKARRVVQLPTETANGTSHLQVGCGYVAGQRGRGNPPVSTGLYINRLSDGREWRLPVGRGGFESALAITCEEIFFFSSGSKSLRNIARVRIADLGPGYAPGADAGL